MMIRLVLLIWCFASAVAYAEPLTLPVEQRPGWLARDGIVMAGSWEPLVFRVRRDGNQTYIPTPEQLAAWEREHSPEMVAQLKALGVNFVMMHCYKGFGLEAERQSMADAVRFSKLCREAGLRVGVYNYSGAFGWELLFKETPQAKDWVILDAKGNPVTYGGAKYRYYWNRNHPGAQAFYRKIIEFAVNDIRADLLHFDNYSVGPGSEPVSVERFRNYLRSTFSDAQRKQLGIPNLSDLSDRSDFPPMSGPPDNILRRAWLDFACKSMAESYDDMARYARTLRKDILTECNPGGVGDHIRPPIDHGRLLQGGEAFWDEGQAPGFANGQIRSRIRTYKVARRMNNTAFTYCITPLEMAETMAFNRDCLGCICWFEYGEIVSRPGSPAPGSPDVVPFVQFFHNRRDLFRDADVVADVAVLRSFASQVFGDSRNGQLTARVEQALIEKRVPFQIIYDHQLDDLKRYRALIIAGCVALSDRQIRQIRQYAKSGGRLCIIGDVATHNEWMIPREKPALDGIAGAVRIGEKGDIVEAVGKACDGQFSLSTDAPVGLCAELTEQSSRRLLHLVNYRSDAPATNVAVAVRLPRGRSAKSVSLAGPERKADSVLPFEGQAGVVKFTVPSIRVYEIVQIALD